MTDIEKAVARWLPEAWRPGRECAGVLEYDGFDRKHSEIWACYECGKTQYSAPSYRENHDASPPPATPELGFRLLEAAKLDCYFNRALGKWVVGPKGFCDPDLLTAVIKAAAALADKEQP